MFNPWREAKQVILTPPLKNLLCMEETVGGKQVHPYLLRQEMAFDVSEGQNS